MNSYPIKTLKKRFGSTIDPIEAGNPGIKTGRSNSVQILQNFENKARLSATNKAHTSRQLDLVKNNENEDLKDKNR